MVKEKKSLSNYTHTFSGWLRLVKGLSEKEIGDLFNDREKWDKLQQEYDDYLMAENERLECLEQDEQLERLEGKATKRKRKGRRTNKGTFHGKSRGKHVGKDY